MLWVSQDRKSKWVITLTAWPADLRLAVLPFVFLSESEVEDDYEEWNIQGVTILASMLRLLIGDV